MIFIFYKSVWSWEQGFPVWAWQSSICGAVSGKVHHHPAITIIIIVIVILIVVGIVVVIIVVINIIIKLQLWCESHSHWSSKVISHSTAEI